MSELQRIVEEARSAIARRPRSPTSSRQGALPRQVGIADRAAEVARQAPAEERPQAGAAINEAKRESSRSIQRQLEALSRASSTLGSPARPST
jgi:hypothetical protein